MSGAPLRFAVPPWVRRRWLELEHAIALMPQYATLFRMTTGGWAGFDPLLEQDSRLVQSWEIERDTRIADALDRHAAGIEAKLQAWVRARTLSKIESHLALLSAADRAALLSRLS